MSHDLLLLLLSVMWKSVDVPRFVCVAQLMATILSEAGGTTPERCVSWQYAKRFICQLENHTHKCSVELRSRVAQNNI